MTNRIVAIDPGREKCGVAIVERGAADPLMLEIVPRDAIGKAVEAAVAAYGIAVIVVGSGTESGAVNAVLRSLGLPLVTVDEYGTTLAARERYYAAHPPRGWRRLIPRGLLVPAVPLDDWAAVIIGERYFALNPPVV